MNTLSSKKMNNLVSIITPSFKSEKYIEKCILSVKGQKYQNIEHIIVDGASPDGTVNVIKKYEKDYNLQWLSEKDRGVADAMNKGFNMAKGDIYAWLDADNYYDSNIVERVVEIFSANPEVDIIYGNITVVDEAGKILYIHRPPNDISFSKAMLLSTGAIPPQPAVFFKSDVFKKSGGFNPSFRIAGDFDFWLKVLEARPNIRYIDENIGFYLKDTVGISQNRRGIINGYKEMRIACNRHAQTFKGEIFLFMKYFKGYVSTFIKK